MFKSKSDIFKHFEFIFAIISLLQLSQAIIPLFLTREANEGDGIDVIGLDLSVHAKISILVYLVVFVLLAMRISIIYAHNGFLGIWLSIGLAGLSVFIVSFFNTIVQSLALLRKTNTPEGFWPLLFLTYILLSNLTEGTISNLNSSFWAIYAAISYSLVIAKNRKYAIAEELVF